MPRFLSLRPVAMQMAASKRFHKFWFLVLENPGFAGIFLLLGINEPKFFLLSIVKNVELFLYLHNKIEPYQLRDLF